MWRLRVLVSRWRSLLGRRDQDHELEGEIHQHLHLLAERFVQQGMSSEEAQYAARRQFGGIAPLQEHNREASGIAFLENFVRDLGFTLRLLRKRPGLSLVVIVVLALGLGANATIFSLVNGILLRPLPFPQPERLVALFERDVLGTNDPYNSVAPANFLDWQKQATSFEQIAGISYTRFSLSSGSESAAAERVDACACSANFFQALRVEPMLGRAFRPDEDRPGSPRVAVISYGLWKRRFHGSPGVLSSAIRLDTLSYTVIGVTPPDFTYPTQSIEVWIPLQTYLPAVVMEAHDNHVLTVIGRLRAGVSIVQARAEIDGIVSRYKRQHPQEVMGKGGSVVSLAEFTVKDIRALLLLLTGAVGCVLLIACVNIANLLLVSAVGRKREVAIRAALGAGRGRIVRQLLLESILLSLAGALGGILLASSLTGYLATRAPNAAALPQIAHIRVDPTVFLFTMILALVTGIVAGLFPAISASSSIDIAGALKDGGRSNTAGRTQNRFRNVLVASEVALSLVLLLAAGLLIRSVGRLLAMDLGLRTSGMFTMRVSLPDAKYHERAQVSAFLKELAKRLRAVPGVRDVGLSSCPTVTPPGFCSDSVFEIEGQPRAEQGHWMDALYRGADPGFFQAAGIPILRGRAFTEADGIGLDDKHPRPGEVVINQALAKQFFASQDPIGQYLTLNWFLGNNADRTRLRYRVVGIAGNVLERPQSPPRPTFYTPLFDGDSLEISINLHTAADPHSVTADARAVVRRMDPDLSVFGIQTVSESVSETIQEQQFLMTLLSLFAGIAIILAIVGLYGVVSWGVSQRANEIAIRMTLGATRAEVHRLILMNGLRPTLLGVGIGTPAAAVAAGLLRSVLFEVRPVDPVTFTVIPLLLVVIAAMACWIPAIRATRLDPTAALRMD